MIKTLAAGLLMISSMAMAEDKPVPAEPAAHPSWTEVRKEAEDFLTRDLVDPESARIKWTRGFEWTSWKQGNLGLLNKRRWGWLACGTINAKNRLGGYAGPERIVMAVMPDGTRHSGLAARIDSHCYGDDTRYGGVVAELK